MTKIHLFLTSLVTAIPGLLLAYLSVMAFLNYAGGGSVVLKGVTGLLLVVGLGMPVLSATILLQGRGGAKAPQGENKATGKKGKKGTADDFASEEVSPESGEAPVTAEIANTGEVEEFALDDAGGDELIVEDDDSPKKKG